jgi:decaprenyl-phosphate phosphoribosyltransferase
VRAAYVVGVALVLVALAVGFATARNLGITLLAYLAITTTYSFWLKRQPVLDIVAVAAGFVLRAIAGGVATSVPLSDWFLIVAGAGSLFIVTGKRHAEQVELGSDSLEHRRTLGEYSTAFLGYVRAVASSVMITAYCLWAFEVSDRSGNPLWFQLAIIPFVLGVLRYALLLDRGEGGAPEEVLLRDRVLLLIGLSWVILFGIAVAGN